MTSLSDQAYHQLRRHIVRLDFEPGAVLREDDLRARLGVGRTPIREAIQRLAREQLVDFVMLALRSAKDQRIEYRELKNRIARAFHRRGVKFGCISYWRWNFRYYCCCYYRLPDGLRCPPF